MLSTDPVIDQALFRSAVKTDYSQHVVNMIKASSRLTEECSLELKKKGSSSELIGCIVTSMNQLEILLQFHGEHSSVRKEREEQLDALTNGLLGDLRNELQGT